LELGWSGGWLACKPVSTAVDDVQHAASNLSGINADLVADASPRFIPLMNKHFTADTGMQSADRRIDGPT